MSWRQPLYLRPTREPRPADLSRDTPEAVRFLEDVACRWACHMWRARQFGHLDLESLTSDMLYGLARAMKLWDPEQGPFGSWCMEKLKWTRKEIWRAPFRRAANPVQAPSCLDEELDPEEELTLGDTIAGPDNVPAEVLAALDAEELRAAVALLPPNERRVIARFWTGETLAEAGKAIGKSMGWAYQLEQSGLARLRGYLAHGPLGGDDE